MRTLAFKWQRIIWWCWQNRSVYREEVYEAALKQNSSALARRREHIEPGKSSFKNAAQKN